jgi:hypothetical protein
MQVGVFLLCREDGGSMFLHIVGAYPPDYMVSHPGGQ